jgi:cytochrome c peroxidase
MVKTVLWVLPVALSVACANGADEAPAGRAGLAGPDLMAAVEADGGAADLSNNEPLPNPSGRSATFSTQGSVDLGGAFFQDFGTNGRTCGTCHAPGEGWSVSAQSVRARFDASQGLDPIFRTVDGSNSPLADVSNPAARRGAYGMLVERGVIRVGRPVPAGAEFELIAVDDPYGFASAAELSLFRRPLPSTNLTFGTNVMWDGRETQPDFRTALGNQANNATHGHAQAAAPLPSAVRGAIVDFESALFTAQIADAKAGRLDAAGARGGPELLASQPLVAAPFDLFNARAGTSGGGTVNDGRRAIARGQALFNAPNAGAGGGACRGCHSAANVGTSAANLFFDIGVSAGTRRTLDLPLYTLRNKATGETRQTTDPGRALTTGRWADVNRFKTPALRGLAARAPFFHNGSARTLDEVVEFYKTSLGFAFTPSEAADLVAFLKVL